MKNSLFMALLWSLLLGGCHPNESDFDTDLRAVVQLDSADIDDIEELMKGHAKTGGLEYSEKDRKRMAFLSEGRDAFYISLGYRGSSVLVLTNVGSGKELILASIDRNDLDKATLDNLLQEVKSTLESRFKIDFKSGPDS